VFNVLTAGEGLKLYFCSHLLMTLNASVVLGIAFMFSCFNMKPAAATILALSLLFVNLVLEGIPFFERYHDYLLTYHFHTWRHVFSQPLPWSQIGQSVCVLLAVNLTTFLIGTAAFQARDIKSLAPFVSLSWEGKTPPQAPSAKPNISVWRLPHPPLMVFGEENEPEIAFVLEGSFS